MACSRLIPSIIQKSSQNHTATVIFLHGLGDSGDGWAPVGTQLASKFPYVKFIFPHAPAQPVTLNMGMVMPSWYDIVSLGDVNSKQDEEGLLKSAQIVNDFVQAEIDAGIPTKRIILGGFSQGCVVSLLTMLCSEHIFGGLVGLSGYVPLLKTVKSMLTETSKKHPFSGLMENRMRLSIIPSAPCRAIF